jgi:DNA-binding transcriptional regulator YiaG
MYFNIYLQKKLEEHNLSNSEFARIIKVNRSSITHWINGTRTPIDNDAKNLKATVKFFARSKKQRQKDLHFIIFGE